MPKKKQTTTKKQPVIDYVDPETNLEEEHVTEVQPDKTVVTIQSVTNTQDTEESLFMTMKRRREKEK
jgi:hypothetical protein